MKLNNIDVYNHLVSIGVSHLYHANSVTTAKTFIEQGGLLSRGAVEKFKLKQTSQNSDDIDKKFGVWNDIFLDSSDLHDLFNRQNFYGPVLFKFNLNILTYNNLPDIYVTKSNPYHWKTTDNNEDRYFQDIGDFSKVYKKGSFSEMLTLKDTFSILPFENYLEEIIIDNPNRRYKGYFLGHSAMNTITSSIQKSDLVIDVKLRKCYESFCNCHEDYFDPKFEFLLKKLF